MKINLYYRGQKCKSCKQPVPVFGLGHYLPVEEGEDNFSRKVHYFSKYGNKAEKDYFLTLLLDFYTTRVEGDLDFDFVCVCPSHKEGSKNPNIVSLVKEFCDKTGLVYKDLLTRIRTVKSQHGLATTEDRIKNVDESTSASENVDGKTVLVFDNTSISGSTFRDIHQLLVHKGNAKTCIFLCLGLGHKAKDIDFDMNPNCKYKVSDMIEKLHWPKVPKGQRISKEILEELSKEL